MRKIRAIVCKASGNELTTIQEIGVELRELQRLVDGYIQLVYLGDGVVLICNEDGKATKPFHCVVPGRAPMIDESLVDFIIKPADSAPPGEMGVHRIYGDFALVREDDEGELQSLTDADVAHYMAILGS